LQKLLGAICNDIRRITSAADVRSARRSAVLRFPVAWVLGGIGLSFAFIAIWVDPFLFDWPQFGAIPSRIFGAIAENLILTAIPMFIFMGTMLERSGVARDLLNCLQVLLRRVPGGLALAVT
jgi:TRAP-type mannitol/chloroaromatic compound transport system permease large subunit